MTLEKAAAMPFHRKLLPVIPPQGGVPALCRSYSPNGSTYDDGELLVSQIVLKAEPTSAGASGSFVDMNGDGCRRAGSGFIAPTNPDTDGPIAVPGAPAGPLKPQSYDGTVGPVTGAVSEVFSGPNSPIRDIGFVAITPNMPAVVVPTRACSCTVVPGCPE